MIRGRLTDAEWTFFERIVIETWPKPRRPPADHRRILDGIFWIARTSARSMARSSTRCGRPESSSKVGRPTSTQSGRINRWATSRQHPTCSCQLSPRRRQHYIGRLRRPRWHTGQLSTNILPGPLSEVPSTIHRLSSLLDQICPRELEAVYMINWINRNIAC